MPTRAELYRQRTTECEALADTATGEAALVHGSVLLEAVGDQRLGEKFFANGIEG
jgi:hypothetical protein